MADKKNAITPAVISVSEAEIILRLEQIEDRLDITLKGKPLKDRIDELYQLTTDYDDLLHEIDERCAKIETMYTELENKVIRKVNETLEGLGYTAKKNLISDLQLDHNNEWLRAHVEEARFRFAHWSDRTHERRGIHKSKPLTITAIEEIETAMKRDERTTVDLRKKPKEKTPKEFVKWIASPFTKE